MKRKSKMQPVSCWCCGRKVYRNNTCNGLRVYTECLVGQQLRVFHRKCLRLYLDESLEELEFWRYRNFGPWHKEQENPEKVDEFEAAQMILEEAV